MPRESSGKQVDFDPVQAYDRIASRFGTLSEERRTYLKGIEDVVIAAIPEGSRSLLDIGAGNGARALRIAQAKALKEVVLLEPSAAMRTYWPAGIRAWPIRAEELSGKHEKFDVITCLWNVLGHIFPSSSRIAVLRECGRLLTPQGRIFIDVNHRYNAAQYGLMPTVFRILHDWARPNEKNGDVTVRWNADDEIYATSGHVFTHSEFCRMAHSAGLATEKQFTVDYSSGKVRQSRFAGNLLYVLRRE